MIEEVFPYREWRASIGIMAATIHPLPTPFMSSPINTALQKSLGPIGFMAGTDASTKHQQDWSGLPPTVPLGVVYPRNTQEVAQVLQHCQRLLTPVVTQGGLTGLAGGAGPVTLWAPSQAPAGEAPRTSVQGREPEHKGWRPKDAPRHRVWALGTVGFRLEPLRRRL